MAEPTPEVTPEVKPMRVIMAGGRDYIPNQMVVHINDLHPISLAGESGEA